jgi:hypothetical protein
MFDLSFFAHWYIGALLAAESPPAFAHIGPVDLLCGPKASALWPKGIRTMI